MSHSQEPAEGTVYDTKLGPREVKSRAAQALVLFVGRSAVLQAVSLGTGVVLARLLTPSNFGILAIGFTLFGIGRLFADTGIGIALVRREASPTRDELRAVTGYQLVVSLLLFAIALSVSLAIGGRALITATMVLALPILAFRTPGILYLDRVLDFSIRVRVEIAESVTYAAWACTTAVIGWGAWSVATAFLAQSIVGAALVIRLAPTGFLLPRFSLTALKPLFSFGLRFQAYTVVTVVHDMLLISGIAAIGGLQPLGMWSFTSRLLAIPQALNSIVLGLAMPAYARLLHAGEKIGTQIVRAATVLGVTSGLFLAPLAGCGAALIPLVFGSKWMAAAVILPGACFGLTLSAPLSICIVDAMFAAGDATTPLRAAAIGVVPRLAVSLIGLRYLGLYMVGVGWVVGLLIGMPLLLSRAHALFGVKVGRTMIGPSIAFALSGAAGWLIVHQVFSSDHLVALAVGVPVSVGTFIATLALVERDALRLTTATAQVVVRETIARRRSHQEIAA